MLAVAALPLARTVAAQQAKGTAARFHPDLVTAAVERSPVIVEGRLIAVPSTQPGGFGDSNRLSEPEDVTVAVGRVVKGKLHGNTIHIQITRMPPLFRRDIGRDFVFFLAGPGPVYSTAPGAPWSSAPAAPIRKSYATPQQTVEAMLSAALMSPQTQASGADVPLMMFLEGDRSQNPVLAEGLQAELRSSSPQAQGEAIAALVARDSDAGYRAAQAYLFAPEPGPAWGDIDNALAAVATPRAVRILSDQATWAPSLQMQDLALYKLGPTHSPEALPALENALRLGTADERASAASGLGHLMLAAAVPALAKALGDADENVRFQAARALARIQDMNNGERPLDINDFRAHEPAYIQFWKKWAADHSPGPAKPPRQNPRLPR